MRAAAMNPVNATALYVSASRLVLNYDPGDPQSFTEINKLLPYFRQSLSCCVCGEDLSFVPCTMSVPPSLPPPGLSARRCGAALARAARRAPASAPAAGRNAVVGLFPPREPDSTRGGGPGNFPEPLAAESLAAGEVVAAEPTWAGAHLPWGAMGRGLGGDDAGTGVVVLQVRKGGSILRLKPASCPCRKQPEVGGSVRAILVRKIGRR